jgi:hypothetical protein
MTDIVKNYIRVLKVISFFYPSKANWQSNCELKFICGVGRKEKISDLELVAMSLTAEFISIDSENFLIKGDKKSKKS